MSYSEENGQVVLTMSREDWELLLMMLGGLMMFEMMNPGRAPLARDEMIVFLNRLNEGNPNYRPSQVGTTTEAS